MPGTILECEGDTAVQIKTDDGRIWRRHLDHVIHRQVSEETGEQNQSDQSDSFVLPPESDPLTAPADPRPTTIQQDQSKSRNENPNRWSLRHRTLSPRDSDDQLETDILQTAINDLFSLEGRNCEVFV